MKSCESKKLQYKSIAIVVGLIFTGFSFAADTAKLIGKNLDENRDLVSSVMKGRNYLVRVDAQGKIKQVIDTGENGDGSNAPDITRSKPYSDSSPANSKVDLPATYQGQDAIDRLGVDLPKVSEYMGLTPEKLKEMLLQDNTMRVDNNGRILYVDNTADQQSQIHADNSISPDFVTAAKAEVKPPVPIAIPVDLANTFLLHSKPGAGKTIYLDFVGYAAQGTAWSESKITAPPYDLTGNPDDFDNSERSNIISIWNRVSEDFIPFDVDVTTEPPSNDALMRTSAADSTYGTRVVITKSVINCGCGGIAYVGVVNLVNNTYYQPAWVFQDGLANNEKYIAEAASHEAGHTLGLLHDGQKPGTGYYSGHGSGVTGWAPIMGVGYYQNVTQWSQGKYPNANNQQDDIATLATYGFLPRNDDYGNVFATASSLTNISTSKETDIQTFGVIEKSTDIDMFIINTDGGVINLTANPAKVGANLDIKLTLHNESGAVVASNLPETTLTASINKSVPPGKYYLAVAGSSHAATAKDYGYPTYGSLGQYKITGSYVPVNPAKPPIARINTSVVTGPAPLTVNFSANNSIGNGSIDGFQWSFGDKETSDSSNPVHTFTTVGDYTAKLIVTNQYQLTDTKTVQIRVNAPPLPTVWASTLNMSIIKTGSIQSSVSLTLVDSRGKPVPNATVTGTFSGSVSGTITSKSDANGNIIQSASTSKLSGGSATYRLNSITAAGYIYNPTKNIKSLVTMSW